MARHAVSMLPLLLLGIAIGWSLAHSTGQVSYAAQTDTSSSGGESAAENTNDSSVLSDDEDRPLDTLDWLVGSWVNETENATLAFTCQYAKNKAFLIRSFKADRDDSTLSGMQVVAWDPSQELIRSWTFDSDGGFGEDVWVQSGDRYTIRTKYTLPDGGVGAALNVLTYIDEDTFTWRSVNREIDGVMQPDSDEITLVRVDSDTQDQVATESAAADVEASNGDAAGTGEQR